MTGDNQRAKEGDNKSHKKAKTEAHRHFNLQETKARITDDLFLPVEIVQEWLTKVRVFEYQLQYDRTCWELIGMALKELHTYPEEFERKTLLPSRYYYRAMNDKQEHAPKMRTIIAIAAGYGFDLSFTNKLLELAGLSLSPADPEHRAFDFILQAMPDFSIQEKNKLLINSGIKPLGSDVRQP